MDHKIIELFKEELNKFNKSISDIRERYAELTKQKDAITEEMVKLQDNFRYNNGVVDGINTCINICINNVNNNSEEN